MHHRVALQRAKRWAGEVEPAASRCTAPCDVSKLMLMYQCYGPDCRSHSHHLSLGGWIMWPWGGSGDRYFCSRQCFLDRLIEHLGGEDQAGCYIDAHWFRDNEVTRLCEDIEQTGDVLLNALCEIEELIDE